MEKIEISRKINGEVEKIIQNFSELCQYLVAENTDECEEMQNLVYSKMCMLRLIDSTSNLHHYLIKLKYYTITNDDRKDDVENVNNFKVLFDKLNSQTQEFNIKK